MKKVINVCLCTIILLILTALYLPYMGIDAGITLDRVMENNGAQYTVMNVKLFGEADSYLLKGNWNDVTRDIKLEHKPKDKYNELNRDEKIIYDAVLNRMWEIYREESDSLLINVCIDDMPFAYKFTSFREDVERQVFEIDTKNVFSALHLDYDWLFWFDHGSSWVVNSPKVMLKDGKLNNSYFTIDLQPNEEYQDSERFKEDAKILYEGSFEAMNEIDDESETLERAKAIGKYIINKLSYNQDVYDEIMMGNIDSNLLPGSSPVEFFRTEEPELVCDGYANVMQMFCDLDGIECYKVVGTINGVDHAWNNVIIDDQLYFVDLTNTEEETMGQRGDLFFVPIEDEEVNTFYLRDEIVVYTRSDLFS